MDYYKIKESSYYNNLRTDILPYIIPNPTGKMLDVGCSSANTLCFLKERNSIGEAVGVDFVTIPGSNQGNPLLDRFIEADLNKQDLPLSQNYFDTLVCADVLEHLVDPWSVILYLKTFLKKDATVIISLPNLREFSALNKIFLKGDFRYASSGIFDKTHMRFFCKKNIIDLVNHAGFKIKTAEPSFKTCPLQKRRKLISQMTFGLFDQFLAQQYIIIATNV